MTTAVWSLSSIEYPNNFLRPPYVQPLLPDEPISFMIFEMDMCRSRNTKADFASFSSTEDDDGEEEDGEDGGGGEEDDEQHGFDDFSFRRSYAAGYSDYQKKKRAQEKKSEKF